MPKNVVPFRIPTETERQLVQLMAYEGQSNKSALLVAAIEERWTRQHAMIHFDGQAHPDQRCPWCGIAFASEAYSLADLPAAADD